MGSSALHHLAKSGVKVRPGSRPWIRGPGRDPHRRWTISLFVQLSSVSSHRSCVASQESFCLALPRLNHSYVCLVQLHHLVWLSILQVLGLEAQAEAPHSNGSHHGHTRVIRTAYVEHPSYLPLLGRAHQLWQELQQASGQVSDGAETGG